MGFAPTWLRQMSPLPGTFRGRRTANV